MDHAGRYMAQSCPNDNGTQRRVPASAGQRAAFVSALPNSETALLRLVALRDVSAAVRAAAATHPCLPSDALAELGRDRSPLVRKAAYSALAARGDTSTLSVALTLETLPELLVAALAGAGHVAAVEMLLEHDAPTVRSAAICIVPPECVRELLADPSPDVRANAREAVVASGIKLTERDVAAMARTANFVDIMNCAGVDSLHAFARAVVMLERIAAGVLHCVNKDETMMVEDVADEAEVALGELVRRHPRFARAYDLAREPANRLVPIFLQNIGTDGHMRIS